TMNDGSELKLEQKYQVLTGSMKRSNKVIPVTAGKLKGNEIMFSVGDQGYKGIVSGKKIDGSYTINGKATQWSATMK
ncbi:MAG: hypothetical protein ACM3NR_00940, partial [Methanosarcina sp.]